jgi:hypothetical protein
VIKNKPRSKVGDLNREAWLKTKSL